MSRGLVVGIGGSALFAAVGVAAAVMFWPPAQPKAPGASVTVLVDFSRSFVPVSQGGSQGLFEADRHALRAVAAALSRLAWEVWTPPVKIVWSPITDGPIVAPFCQPLVLGNILVPRPGEVSGQAGIERALLACVDEIATAGKDAARLSPYTDISAAVAGASASSAEAYHEQFLVILSDFREDLSSGRSPAPFRVPGHRVILLHRPGTDEPESVPGYLARIDTWKERFRQAGAVEAGSLPVFAASRSRVQLALRPDPEKPMTSLTVLVDPRTNVFRSTGAGGVRPDGMVRLAQELARFPESKAWKPPVTAQWAVVTSDGLRLRAGPPVDFDPTFPIPRVGEINRTADFEIAMEESAQWAFGAGRGVTQSTLDLSGSLALLSSLEPMASAHVVVILSDFAAPPVARRPLRSGANGRFLLLHAPGREMDQTLDEKRRETWKRALMGDDETGVCLFPLGTWTPAELGGCLVTGPASSN